MTILVGKSCFKIYIRFFMRIVVFIFILFITKELLIDRLGKVFKVETMRKPTTGSLNNRQSIPPERNCFYEDINVDLSFSPKLVELFCPFIHVYKNTFVHLEDVMINPVLARRNKGGEEIHNVTGQSENDENLHLQNAYFTIDCALNHSFIKDNAIFLYDYTKDWLQLISTKNKFIQDYHKENIPSNEYDMEEVFTIAIQRSEYANLYHTLTEWYNVFLLAYFFRKTANCTFNILFVDGHPRSQLDITWSVLFGKVARASFLQKQTLYRNLVWNIPGLYSPMVQRNHKLLPMVETFRNFVLNKHGIVRNEKRNCLGLNILFILRRDYIAHPRNPSGKIKRKIKNELEILEKLTSAFPKHKIFGIQLDTLSMKEQLNIVSKTDVLIGMHGAGMSHVLFLPKTSGVIELFPLNVYPSNKHFKAFSKWRNLFYASWQNVQTWHDFPSDESTYIPVNVIQYLIRRIIRKMCNENK